jgi:hypothetical protein
MPANLSFSTWNIHDLKHSVLGDKTKNQDFMDNLSIVDFVFLTETWSKIDIDVPGFKAIVSDTAIPHTDKASRLSGGITLLIQSKFEKYVSIAKNSKNFLWCKISKDLLNTDSDLFLCGTYIPPEKSPYFDNELFDELENYLIAFASKGNTMILGDLMQEQITLMIVSLKMVIIS